MNTNNLSAQQQQMLLQMAGKKLGISPDALRAQIENGNVQKILQQQGTNIPNIGSVLGNKAAMEQMLNSPEAQALIQQLKGGK